MFEYWPEPEMGEVEVQAGLRRSDGRSICAGCASGAPGAGSTGRRRSVPRPVRSIPARRGARLSRPCSRATCTRSLRPPASWATSSRRSPGVRRCLERGHLTRAGPGRLAGRVAWPAVPSEVRHARAGKYRWPSQRSATTTAFPSVTALPSTGGARGSRGRSPCSPPRSQRVWSRSSGRCPGSPAR